MGILTSPVGGCLLLLVKDIRHVDQGHDLELHRQPSKSIRCNDAGARLDLEEVETTE